MEIRKPDLNAPRARMDAGYCPVDISFWRKFKRETGIECSYKEFSQTIKEGNGVISEIVCNERDGFKLMNDIGTLMMVACKPPKRFNNYDYGRLNKEGIKVKHQNWDTDRFLNHILYVTYHVRERFSNRKLWEFKPIRELKRESSKKFRDNYEMYKKVQVFERVANQFLAEKRVIKELEEQNDFLKTYNDFELDD